jgi:hypothetical protein
MEPGLFVESLTPSAPLRGVAGSLRNAKMLWRVPERWISDGEGEQKALGAIDEYKLKEF